MPTRYLKPGVRDSEAIDNLSPQAENIFYRLLVTVDDFGRFDARPAMIKAQCFPIKESVSINKCKELLEELSRANLILLYEAEGKPYLQMCKWDNIPRAKESKYPAHEGTCIQMYTDVPLTETETETKTKTKTETTPEGVSQEVWDSFVKQRKTKRAQVTQLVIDGIAKQAEEAGWTLEAALQEVVIRNWQSFKAEWVADKPKMQNKWDVVGITTPTPPNQDAALRKIAEDRKKAVPPSLEVLAKLAELRKGVVQ